MKLMFPLQRQGLRWLAALGLILAGLFGLAAPVARATDIGTTPHISLAGHYNYVVTGGTLRAANNATNPCSLLSGQSGASVNAGTSNATLSGIPSGSTIVGAYLYFIGDGDTPDYTVAFNGNILAADRQYSDQLYFASANGGNAYYKYFGGFIDVTGLVDGNGNYSFGGLSVQNVDDLNYGEPSYCTNQGVVVGWALVVVYQDASQPLRVINIFDGLQHFYNSNITLTPGNFKIPASPINGKMTVITWGGDEDISGNEALRYNGNTLRDSLDPAGNQFNATINTLGSNTTWGVDVDTYDISPYLAAGQTTGSTYYATGADDNYLTAQIISVTNTPVADLAITASHSGNFAVGGNGVYTLAIHNNGPNATSGTTRVADTLPTGFSYVSATGVGWNCSASGQNVSCATTTAIASDGNAAPITLTVAVAGSAPASVTNTASVTVDSAIFDNIGANNTSSDPTTIAHPNLSKSTKTVMDTNGGDTNPGDTLEYTITLKETGGVDATGVSVTDDMPQNVTGLTVITPTGITCSTTGSTCNTTGGANGTGRLDISNITVPANGTKTIVYDVTVDTAATPGTTIDNSATITNPNADPAGSTTTTVAAPTITVAPSRIPVIGNKLLYVYDDKSLTRTPQTAGGSGVIIPGNSSTPINWTLTQALSNPLTLVGGSTININLLVKCDGGKCKGNDNNFTAALYDVDGATSTSVQIGGTSASASFAFSSYSYTSSPVSISVPAAGYTLDTGHQLQLRITNESSKSDRGMSVEQYEGGRLSTISLNVSDAIQVQSVQTYANPDCTGSPVTPVYEINSTIYICAVVSDAFGSTDIAPAGGKVPTITITDVNGTQQQLNNGASVDSMIAKTPLTPIAPTRTFGYTYTVPTSPPPALGPWTASVTAWEGTEGTMSHTNSGGFEIGAPDLVVVKSVSVVTDPVNGSTNPKALPGATMQYSIIVTNQGKGAVDANQLNITDPIPANTAFVVGSVGFTDGSTSSGLTLDPATNVSYSNDGGATWTNTPVGTVTNLRFSPQGSMNGKTGASAPACTITFQVKIL